MIRGSRAGRLFIVLTALAVLNGAAAAAWAPAPATDDQASEHCRAMRVMHARMQHCERAAAMSCCRENQTQPDSTLPPVPASGTTVGAQAMQTTWLPVTPGALTLHAGTAWYARPPTHGYSSQSLRLLQSVLLI